MSPELLCRLHTTVGAAADPDTVKIRSSAMPAARMTAVRNAMKPVVRTSPARLHSTAESDPAGHDLNVACHSGAGRRSATLHVYPSSSCTSSLQDPRAHPW